MKLDDEARAYFGSHETLERLDSLQSAFDAYLRDLAERLLDQISDGVNALSQTYKGWTFEREKTAKERGILLRKKLLKDTTEVGFWCTENDLYSCFNSGWVGVKSAGKRRRDEIYSLLSSSFLKPRREPDYIIFEYVKSWPNLDNEQYVSLYGLTNDNGKKVINAIIDQIDVILKAVETTKTSKL